METCNSERTITKYQKFIIFNNIYQYFKFHNSNNNNSFLPSTNVKIQSFKKLKYLF